MSARAGAAPPWWQKETAPGVLLVLATLISFTVQNSPLHTAFDALLHQEIGIAPGPAALRMDLLHFITDGLMAVFFLYVGLELKRETIEGPFRNRDEAAVPAIAALGGMAAPALIYLTIAGPSGYARGWAIPAATDIAFALGVLSLLGPRVPASLRLFLLALAIIDDIGAILIIAVFYSAGLTAWALGAAVLTFLAMLMLNWASVKRLGPYWLLALVLWSFMLASGVHATIAGVLTALAIPMRAGAAGSPLIAAEHALKPAVLLAIMPIFALANAGAPLAGMGLGILAHPAALGAALGLALGKPLGICASVWLAARLLKLPPPGPPLQILGIAMLAGIGFTMSLFIAALAFGDGPLAAPTRLGILAGSLISAIGGLVLLARVLPKAADKAKTGVS